MPVRSVPTLAFRAWLTPPPAGRSSAGRDPGAFEGTTPGYLGGVAVHEVGSGPLAFAVHGWGGRAVQMAPIARRLAAEGFRVVVPELPGHAGGAHTDIKQVAAALQTLIEEVGRPEVVVGHSFAGLMFRLAFESTAPPRMVLVAPVLDVNDALDVFADRLRLLPWARRGLRHRIQAWDTQLWPRMSDVFPDQFPGTEVLIMHDPDDQEASFARAAELAALRPNTSIVALDGAGHSRILSDTRTTNHIAAFALSSARDGQFARQEPLP